MVWFCFLVVRVFGDNRGINIGSALSGKNGERFLFPVKLASFRGRPNVPVNPPCGTIKPVFCAPAGEEKSFVLTGWAGSRPGLGFAEGQ